MDRSLLQTKFRRLLNGIAKTQDPLNVVAHHLFVATEGERYFSKAREAALAEITRENDAFNRIVAETTRKRTRHEGVIASTPDYVVTLQTNAPVKRVNVHQMGQILVHEHGWSVEQVEKLMGACTTYSAPAKIVRAVPNGDVDVSVSK